MIPFPRPVVHRIINLILHLIAVILLLKNLEALKAPGAYAATLVFAIHPAVVQTVFWAGYRTEILGLILALSALYYGITNRSARDYLVTILLTTLACLIHPAAISIPVILSLVIVFQNKSLHLHLFNRILPLLCIALFTAVWTQFGTTDEVNTLPSDTYSYLHLLGQNMFFNIRQVLLPITPALFYPVGGSHYYQMGSEMSFLPFLLFIPFYVLIGINFRHKWSRAILLGLTSYLTVSLITVSHTGAFLDGSLANEDHTLYLALPFIIGLLICASAHTIRRLTGDSKLLWKIGISIFILIELATTSPYTYAIGSPVRMWQSMTEQWPDSWIPKAAFLQTDAANQEKILNNTERINMLVDILQAKPELVDERILLARTYAQEGQNTNALREYKRILRESDPDNEFLEEAAHFYDKMGMSWEASTVRKRINP